MISSVRNSLSALYAFGKKMGVTANNVANLQSDGFKKSKVVLEEGPGGSVKAEINPVDSPGNVVYEENGDGRLVGKELSNVDLSEEIPQTVLTRRGYETNLRMIETDDEMLGSVLDIMG
jgi:flagellar basal body rod protein FlgG